MINPSLASRSHWALLPCLAAALLSGAPVSRTAPQYHVARRFVIDSGDGDFLAVDPVRRRLFGAAYRVIDIDRDTVIGTLPPHSGYAFAIAPELNRGLGRRGQIFDLTTFAPIAHVAATGDAAVYDAVSGRAFLLMDKIAVVDMRTAMVLSSIQPTEGMLSEARAAVGDGRGHLYVSVQARTDTTAPWQYSVAEVDTKTLHVARRLAVGPCVLPLGIAMDEQHRRLFVSCKNGRMQILDPDRNTIVASVPVTGDADAVAFDPETQLIFNPNGDGTMTVIHEDSPNQYSITQRVATTEAGRSIALDPKSHRVYLLCEHTGGITIVRIDP